MRRLPIGEQIEIEMSTGDKMIADSGENAAHLGEIHDVVEGEGIRGGQLNLAWETQSREVLAQVAHARTVTTPRRDGQHLQRPIDGEHLGVPAPVQVTSEEARAAADVDRRSEFQTVFAYDEVEGAARSAKIYETCDAVIVRRHGAVRLAPYTSRLDPQAHMVAWS